MYSNAPMKLQRALSELASESDCTTTITRSHVTTVTSGAKQFAAAVAAALDGSALRYSVRKQLIQQAATLGIRRFDANLIIAAVQHRLQGKRKTSIVEMIPPASSAKVARWMAPTCVVVILQLMICGAMYVLFHG